MKPPLTCFPIVAYVFGNETITLDELEKRRADRLGYLVDQLCKELPETNRGPEVRLALFNAINNHRELLMEVMVDLHAYDQASKMGDGFSEAIEEHYDSEKYTLKDLNWHQYRYPKS